MVEPALIILAALCIKHFFADFMLQFPYMIEQKGTYGAEGGIHHATIHAAFTFMILSFTMHPFMMISLAALDGILHYHIDWAKMNAGKGLTPADKKFWVWIGFDQLLHMFTYILIVGILF